MDEDALLTLFEKTNVKIGNLKPDVIKAWFDTDCHDLLKWMCTSLTEESYVSSQEEFEYSQCDILTHDQLQNQVSLMGSDYSDIFQIDKNLTEIEFSKSRTEMLEEELKESNHQICVNRELHQTLLAELSLITMKQMQAQLEEESAQENFVTLNKELDKIYSQTYNQILKYGSYLRSYEFGEIPEFANKVDITEFEQKFSSAVNSLNSLIQIQHDSFEVNCVKNLTDTLCELENCIFQSKVSLLALQMEVEALNSTLKFLETYDVSVPWIDHESLELSIGGKRDQQTWMVNVIEESSLQLAQHYIKQPTLQCLKNEFDFFQLKLSYLNKSTESFVKILCHFIIIHGLYLQEKVDINSSSQFFRNINKYVNIDVMNTSFRIEAMLRLISGYEDYCSCPFEIKLKMVRNFGTILLKRDNTSLLEVMQEFTLLRNDTKTLKNQQWRSVHIDKKVLKKLGDNNHVLQNFLICGPTFQMLTVPGPLRALLLKVNQSLLNQHSSVKLLIQAAQKPKDLISKDKWVKYQNLVWTYFMTDSVKLLSFLGQLKADEKPLKEKDI